MHLTNYSVNKHNKENFIYNNYDNMNNNDSDNSNNDKNTINNEEKASKRSLSWLWKYLQNKKNTDIKKIWSEICDIIVKTLISIQISLKKHFDNCKIDGLNKNPFTCFEV
jgi:tubulin polyglutamylase TTLL6/13